MKAFRCECGAPVFFTNSQCLSCSRELGFIPDRLEMVAFSGDGQEPIATPHGQYRKCANYLVEGVCNWLVAADSNEQLCQACRLNDVIPNLSEPENRRLWHDVEQAKRRLIYSLDALNLPLLSKADDAEKGLSFDIKQSSGSERVLTGHAEGLITLNLSEADDAEREKIRLSLNERYRTLLGHFRHEIGHYYWDRLVADPGEEEAFRELFGDERADYGQALKVHYSKPVDPNYSAQFISNYAASHPWEDFAETFAHYLHMIDTLETAEQYGFASLPATGRDFEGLMAEWYRLTVALNALNRSMGLADAYPFAIAPPVKQKLSFVHDLVHAARRASSEATFSSSTRAGPGISELSASTAV
ncbi:MAG TPA: putative zinc-binding peptidase [Polyangiaceae bacterium]|nr:putative zinc-binding peptidase [Polyangiaceae bacterium]